MLVYLYILFIIYKYYKIKNIYAYIINSNILLITI